MKFVVTAGPTREPIDPVRFLSNRSSGQMGYAIAEAASQAGHEVVLISGPVSLAPPEEVQLERTTTSDEMFAAVERAVRHCDVFIMCAAVADYKPAQYAAAKIKKENAPRTLDLVPTRDILSAVAQAPRDFLVVGFAAETDDLLGNARRKLRAKNCDLLVANDVSGAIGMESAENEVVVLHRNGEEEKIARASKKIIAQRLVKIILRVREKRLTKKT